MRNFGIFAHSAEGGQDTSLARSRLNLVRAKAYCAEHREWQQSMKTRASSKPIFQRKVRNGCGPTAMKEPCCAMQSWVAAVGLYEFLCRAVLSLPRVRAYALETIQGNRVDVAKIGVGIISGAKHMPIPDRAVNDCCLFQPTNLVP